MSASKSKLYDVAIVGAGPAGSTLANHLVRSGYKTLILEKSRFPRTKVCGDLISAKGLATLDALGCLEEVERQSYVPIEYATVFLNGQEFSRQRVFHIKQHVLLSQSLLQGV